MAENPTDLPPPDVPAPEVVVPVEQNATMLELPAPPVHQHTPAARQKNGPPSHRDDMVIPDYTLIRRIGSGAYGEVWLAQSVTGAYRAVKIVWREDFELTRTFQREFLGIQQFEPISRGHPCLVHILHVGWNENRGFYYCVMELADDAEEGASFENLQTYVPRTLGTDMKRHGRLDLVFCRDAGVYLADALHYMHNHGLTHRDIKPSNIIFVGGVCKLADIGLVAALGERTFVGTEGFVPPEGPGTPQADIYSLGKVLYEMSSGKDRMEFPEVPPNLSDEEWPFWMDLNRVICKACAPDLNERFQHAGEFAEALQKVGGKKVESLSRRLARAAFFTLVGSALAGGGLHAGKYQREWAWELPLPVKPAPAPIQPQNGKPWQNIYGQWYSFVKDRHVADLPVEVSQFRAFLEATLRAAAFDVVPFTTPDKRVLNCVMVPASDADAFCAWMTSRDRQSGRLDIDHEYAWRAANIKLPPGMTPTPGRQAVRTEVVVMHYGRVSIDSTPRGAEVFNGELVVGRTPLKMDKTRADKFAFEIRLPGYKSEMVQGELKEGQSMSFNLRLRATGAVVFSKPWENSLGMKLVPMGRAMFAATETRRKDFAEFARTSNLPPVTNRDLDKALDLPVTNVTRSEAEQFCRWLTDRERAKGLLEPDQEYRLPTDDEWSMAVNLPREIGESADQRSAAIGGFYPWGFTSTPPSRTGNFFDKTADPSGKKSITGYTDGHAGPAPVASFKPDPRTQVYDLAGNVWEWVSDSWAADPTEGIVRGGAFTTSDARELLASFRRKVRVSDQLSDVGFRIVLAIEGLKAREDE
jgi:serine/threonine protein kinase